MPAERAPRRGGGGGGPIVQPVDDDDDDDEEPDDVDDDFPAGMPAHAYPGGPYPPGRDAGLPDMPEVCCITAHEQGRDCSAACNCSWNLAQSEAWERRELRHGTDDVYAINRCTPPMHPAPLDQVFCCSSLPPAPMLREGWHENVQGVDLEEARMLEAAMFGVAYQGRMPDYNGLPAAGGGAYGGPRGRGAHHPLDPHVLEGRMLREEQELAYQESLQVRHVDCAVAAQLCRSTT